MLDPCAIFLSAAASDDLESCDGYLQHARRLSKGGTEPGFLRLAHAFANDSCVTCDDFTRWMAYREGENAAGPARCCAACPLGGMIEKTEQLVFINSFLFQNEPVTEIDGAEDEAATELREALESAQDGDTIALRGAFEYDDELGFCTSGGKAVRLLGLDPPPGQSSIHAANHCLQINAPGAILENLSLSSGSVARSRQLRFLPGPGAFAGVYGMHISPSPDRPRDRLQGSPSIIVKDCLVKGRCGSAMVLGEGTRCACLRSRFNSPTFVGIAIAETGVVLRLSGCVLDGTNYGSQPMQLRGRTSDAAVRALGAANRFAGVQNASREEMLREGEDNSSYDLQPHTVVLV